LIAVSGSSNRARQLGKSASAALYLSAAPCESQTAVENAIIINAACLAGQPAQPGNVPIRMIASRLSISLVKRLLVHDSYGKL
jgi:hypothetical protein